MADSAPDPKVEDVLSSVRRLVSGEIPRRASRPSQRDKDAGALVLTPAHRVAEKPRSSAARPARSLEERIAELEAAVDRTSLEFEPDGSEDQSLNRPDRIVYTRPPRAEEVAERSRRAVRLSQIELIETGPAVEEKRAGEDAPVAFRHETSRIEPEADDAEAPMAENVAPAPRERGEVRAFSSPEDVLPRIEARIAKGGEAPYAPTPAPADPKPEAERAAENLLREDEKADETPPDDFDAALSAAVAASVASAVAEETGVKASPNDFLDQDEVLAYVEPAGTASEAPEEAEDADEEDGDTSDPESVEEALASLPDEEAMRLLVARLIREELQGELGERITRNVRKLVRREIMRALDSRDLV
jgi:hypothetical protein